jgi:hypothetical protein
MFGYSRSARLTVWALTLPQVAATLAAALVAYDTRNAVGERLLDGNMLNAVLVLLLATSILGQFWRSASHHGCFGPCESVTCGSIQMECCRPGATTVISMQTSRQSDGIQCG